MKMNKSRFIQLLGTALTILVINACSSGDAKDSDTAKSSVKKVPVRVAQVEERLMSVPLNSIGKVYAQKESTLSFKTGGIIDEIYVNNGQKVVQGQLLAKLDLAEVSSAVKKARVAFEKAERDLKRADNLHKENVVTLETLQNARTAFDVASSDLTIAQFNLTHSVIKAPSNGLIVQKMSEEGELTNAGAPVFEFAGTNQNWVIKSGLVDKEIVKIMIGDNADVSFDAYGNDSFTGLVSKISNAPDPMNGTYEVEVSLVEVPNSLKKGFIAKLSLTPSVKENYKLIPIESLAEADNDEGVIYTVKNHRPQKVKVKIETIIEDKVLVHGDLGSNDMVISEGITDINQNSIVEIL